MIPRGGLRAWALGTVLAAGTPGARAQAPPVPVTALITISVDRAGTVRVAEMFSGAGTLPHTFRILREPCAALSEMRFSMGGAVVPAITAARGPWLDVTLDAASGLPASASVALSYEVNLRARTAGIPLVVPTVALASAEDVALATSGGARLELELPPDAAAYPVLPQFARAGPGRWTARLIALPSVVRVDRGGQATPAACGERRARASAGTFGLRLGLFLATMALWVPLYFWWAVRQDRTP